MAFIETIFGVRVADSGTREPAAYVEIHFAPVQPLLVTPPAQAAVAAAGHLVMEASHRFGVPGHGIIAIVPPENRSLMHPAP
jgi:hypothetical protein